MDTQSIAITALTMAHDINNEHGWDGNFPGTNSTLEKNLGLKKQFFDRVKETKSSHEVSLQDVLPKTCSLAKKMHFCSNV